MLNAALAAALSLSLAGAPKADVTVQLRVDDYPRLDDAFGTAPAATRYAPEQPCAAVSPRG